MITQLYTILNFPQFYANTSSVRLPIKTAYKLSRLSTAINTEIEFYQNRFREIVTEYCETDENGNFIPTENGQGFQLRPGTEVECNAAVNELHSLEIILPDITFSIEEFEGMELSVQDMEGIIPFIVN